MSPLLEWAVVFALGALVSLWLHQATRVVTKTLRSPWLLEQPPRGFQWLARLVRWLMGWTP